MPSRPSSPSFGHRSRGNSFLRSISSARGAIFACEKRARCRAACRRLRRGRNRIRSSYWRSWRILHARYLSARVLRRVGRILQTDHGREHARDQLRFPRRVPRSHRPRRWSACVPDRSTLPFGDKTLADCRRHQIDLQFDSERRGAFRHQRIGRKASRGIGKRRGDPAMQEAALLAEIGPRVAAPPRRRPAQATRSRRRSGS